MIREYEGSCKRTDLQFRTKYPHLSTRLFKVSDEKFLILIRETVSNFEQIQNDFDQSIVPVTAPIYLTIIKPSVYQEEIIGIKDESIPSNFEGTQLTRYQIANHIACTHPHLSICKIQENHSKCIIVVELQGEPDNENKQSLQRTLNTLKNPYRFKVISGGNKKVVAKPSNEVFQIASSSSKKELCSPYLERDERLWFDNIESIYNGKLSKKDLFFYNPEKTSCLVNFSLFKNANLRNHILLYDVVSLLSG